MKICRHISPIYLDGGLGSWWLFCPLGPGRVNIVVFGVDNHKSFVRPFSPPCKNLVRWGRADTKTWKKM